MKILYSWIRELVPDLTQSPNELARLLTEHSYETVVEREYTIDPAITVVEITGIDPHPNADKLQLATITDGGKTIRVVCGAPNIEPGQRVAYAPPGVRVYGEDGAPFEIQEATIRGEKSPGMLMSARELGIAGDHAGIFVLPPDVEVGSKLIDRIPSDAVLDADVLPDRAHDSLCHLGVAREAAALLELEVAEPKLADMPKATENVEGFTLHIENKRIAPRYMGVVLSNISQSHTPLTIQVRLLAMGVRPKNSIVDITNYVMFEVGNPTHAFDRAKLNNETIKVTESKADFFFDALDGKQYKMPLNAPLIMSGADTIAAGGIIGGEGSAVDDRTQDILLEVATFNAFSIQEAARAMGIRTEASARFSKSLSVGMAGIAAGRAVQLLQDVTSATVRGVLDTHPQDPAPWIVSFRPQQVSAYAGVDISANTARDVLTRLRCSVEGQDDTWQVTVPPDRLDLAGEHDLIDEVIRVHGLSNIASNSNTSSQPALIPNGIYWRERIRTLLRDHGLTETYNYSFEPQKYAKLTGVDGKEHISIQNPIAPQMANMRFSLMPSLIQNMVTNRDYIHRYRNREQGLFEFGNVYHPGDTGYVPGVVERPVVGGIMVGNGSTVRDILDKLLQAAGIEGVVSQPFSNDAFTKASYKLAIGDRFLGMVYVLSDVLRKNIKYTLPVVGFELSVHELILHVPDRETTPHTLETIRQQTKEPALFTPLPIYPSIFRDISIIVDADASVEVVQEVIERTGGTAVVDVDLFDEYVPEGQQRKGLAFHIEYRSDEKTLTDDDINPLHMAIIEALQSELNADIR